MKPGLGLPRLGVGLVCLDSLLDAAGALGLGLFSVAQVRHEQFGHGTVTAGQLAATFLPLPLIVCEDKQ